jgi:hypothetical protein
MNIWGKIILTIDMVVLVLLMRSAIRLIKVIKSAGERAMHVFPTPKLLAGTLIINFFGMFVTVYSYVKSFNIIYLLFLSVFLLNSLTVFQRLISVHDSGIIVQGKLITFKEIKRVVWGEGKKRFVALQLILKDRNQAPVFVSIPVKRRDELANLLRRRML